ncbi:hypothetical protein [Pseudoflavonifractor sp. An85]|uniref:hypothetical protein n=1 Tax=Pseudoflavonifractor sp. An85 TaxID=1965661 RepID=UPI000B39289A|nr:hypothetical protein [Pseudoflavonifractor sp. An85]OUN24865.1 hypothetical protein B5G37_05635 [Pseudoflavonifractor sp. An85]
MATQRKVRSYATYGNVAYKVDSSAQTKERRRVEQPRRPRVQPRERVASRPQVQVRQQSAVAPFTIVGFVAAIACALLLVISSAQLAMVNAETVELRSTLSGLQDEKKTLMAQYEKTFDLSALEQLLTADGSMVEAGAGQTVYLDLSQGDSVVYYEEARQGISGLVRQIEEFLSGMLS